MGWLDGWMDIDRQAGCTDRLDIEWTDTPGGQTDRQNGWIDRLDGQTDRQTEWTVREN